MASHHFHLYPFQTLKHRNDFSLLSCFPPVQEMAFYYLFILPKTFLVKKQKKAEFSRLPWERFREFHLTSVGFSFLFCICNLLYICRLLLNSDRVGTRRAHTYKEIPNATWRGYPAFSFMTVHEKLCFSSALTLQDASVRYFWHSQSSQKYLYAWLLGHKILHDNKVLSDYRIPGSMNQNLILQRSHIKQHRTRILFKITY